MVIWKEGASEAVADPAFDAEAALRILFVQKQPYVKLQCCTHNPHTSLLGMQAYSDRLRTCANLKLLQHGDAGSDHVLRWFEAYADALHTKYFEVTAPLYSSLGVSWQSVSIILPILHARAHFCAISAASITRGCMHPTCTLTMRPSCN